MHPPPSQTGRRGVAHRHGTPPERKAGPVSPSCTRPDPCFDKQRQDPPLSRTLLTRTSVAGRSDSVLPPPGRWCCRRTPTAPPSASCPAGPTADPAWHACRQTPHSQTAPPQSRRSRDRSPFGTAGHPKQPSSRVNGSVPRLPMMVADGPALVGTHVPLRGLRYGAGSRLERVPPSCSPCGRGRRSGPETQNAHGMEET